MRSNPRLPPLAAIALLLGSGLADATVQRTFVASTGVDTNACSLIAPCRSFGAAIAKTTAGGEVIVLDSAGYGPVVIAKAVSLIAPPGVYAGVTVSSGDGITVDAFGAPVVLRGLSINGQGGGTGIYVVTVGRLRIEGCVISNMSGNGLVNFGAGSEMIMLDTIVRDNGGTGISINANAIVVLDHVRSEHNGFDGFYIVPSNSESTATITDSAFARNGVNGISVGTAANAKTYVQVERSMMSNNGANGFLASAAASGALARVTLVHNAINRNALDGILMTSSAPGIVLGSFSENAIQANSGNGIRANGSADLKASANTVSGSGASDLRCDNAGSGFRSLGNNSAGNVSSVGGCMFVTTGY